MYKFQFTSILHLYKKPPVLLIAAAELEESKRDLLAAQTAQAYAEASVSFNQAQVDRLTAYIADSAAGKPAKLK